ncbi:unnamed protein product [Larinioides sclopetarius]|uniref:Uncharacterized protein n=1 Tax=Larinioides sclopetarius TaxID=280406 RepID=A0AAV1ZM08_9ARAC
MKKTLCLTITFGLILSSFAFNCPNCDLQGCRNPGSCPRGKTSDLCKCCPGIGEQCGGPLNTFGVCMAHLSCVPLPEGQPNDPTHSSNVVGICLALP